MSLARRVERANSDKGRKRRAAQAMRAAYRAGENARAKYVEKMEPVATINASAGARRKAS